MNEEIEYYRRLNQKVEQILSSGITTFQDILRQCEGAYPSVVRKQLSEMMDQLEEISIPALRLSNADKIPHQALTPITSTVEGNPTLSSWYFTNETCARIAAMKDWQTSKILFLGTPRLYEWFRNSNLGKGRTLLDLDEVVIQKLSSAYADSGDILMTYDIRSDLPLTVIGEHDYIFFDPPWYLDYYYLWLFRACQAMPKQAILFSLFPPLTRPSAAREREELFAVLQKTSGNYTILENILEYEIPSFEQAQLRSIGLENLVTWKIADLVIVEAIKTGLEFPVEIPKLIGIKQSSDWKEIDVLSIRFFVRSDNKFLAEADDQLLYIIEESLVLSSPSRRNPKLSQVNVFTSRGHGFATRDPERLIRYLLSLNHQNNLTDVLRNISLLPLDDISASILSTVFTET